MIVVPDRWREVLDQLHNGGFPEAVIAGGALRDLDHGKPVKDVDIWVRRVLDNSLMLELLEKAMGYGVGNVIDTDELIEAGYDESLSGLAMVADFEHEAHNPKASMQTKVEALLNPKPNFQIMAMDLPFPCRDETALTWGDVVTNDFDLGLNRVFYDGVNTYMTAAYCIDSLTKSMTVLRCRNERELERIKSRIERLKQKYPDFQPKNVEVRS